MQKLTFSKISSARLLSCWADEGIGWMLSPAAEFAAREIDGGNMEAWTAQCGEEITALLLLVKALPDRDFADGEGRCYLWGFRVTPALRGQGIGTALLRRVLARARELGFREASIGVEEREEANLRLYRREGFTKPVKTALYDPCTPMPDGRPCEDNFLLLVRTLYEE